MVSNLPELNPLDNSCFRDLRTAINLNVAATWHLPKENSLKFSLATPSAITKSFMRIWHPTNGCCPSSRRILQDVRRVLTSLATIVEAEGHIVPGLVNRNGHRAVSANGNRRDRLCRKKETLEEVGIHESIYGVVEEQYKEEKRSFFSELGTHK